MTDLKVGFIDFWGDYIPENEYIYKTLQKKYNVIVDNNNPDFLFFSCYGCKHVDYKNVVKIFYTHENLMPNFNLCDYSLSFMRDSLGGRNLYFPPAMRYDGQDIPPLSDALLNRKFCNFLYSQDYIGSGARLRKEVCLSIMKYRSVDCPGKILHNMEAPELSRREELNWNNSKINFLKNYKFTIAYENTNSDGYMTEKLLDPLLAGSVPIYWGSEGNVFPFSKDCMICASDYPDMESLLARIKEVDENDSLYMSMCQANPLRKALLTHAETRLLDFFEQIYERGTKPLLKDELKLDTVAHILRSSLMRKAFKLDQWLNEQAILKKVLKLLKNQ